MNKRFEVLIRRAGEIAADERPRRRIELVEQATGAGHSIEYADSIYNIAEEVGIDPALAFELVLNGIGVRSSVMSYIHVKAGAAGASLATSSSATSITLRPLS